MPTNIHTVVKPPLNKLFITSLAIYYGGGLSKRTPTKSMKLRKIAHKYRSYWNYIQVLILHTVFFLSFFNMNVYGTNENHCIQIKKKQTKSVCNVGYQMLKLTYQKLKGLKRSNISSTESLSANS